MSRTDAELVVAFRGGDHDAFAEIYDRYADRIHTFAYARLRRYADAEDALRDTFVRASTRLHQLEDPERFRPWLFAIARTAVTDPVRDRAKTRFGEDIDENLSEVVADDTELSDAVEADDIALLVWNTAASLRDRDQELVEIHLREGLEGDDLALAMGVKPVHVSVMVDRLKRRLEIAVGSLLVARRGRDECIDLDRILSEWDGRYSTAIRSKVGHHIESCDVCSETSRAAIAWERVAAAMPFTWAPTRARTNVMATLGLTPVAAGTGAAGGSGGSGGDHQDPSPVSLRPHREGAAKGAAAARPGRVRALAGRIDAGVFIAAVAVAAAGVALVLSMDSGGDAEGTEVVVTSTAAAPTTTVTTTTGEGSVAPVSSTTVDPTATTVPSTTADPTPAILVGIPPFPVTPDNDAPELSSVAIVEATIYEGTPACLASTLPTSTSVLVTASDDAGVDSVVVQWSDGAVTLTSTGPSSYEGVIGPWSGPVEDGLVVTATDTSANTASTSLTVAVDPCPL